MSSEEEYEVKTCRVNEGDDVRGGSQTRTGERVARSTPQTTMKHTERDSVVVVEDAIARRQAATFAHRDRAAFLGHIGQGRRRGGKRERDIGEE